MAFEGPDGGVALVGLYHTNNGGVFLEKDGTRPGASELSVYVAESAEALRSHLITKQFEHEMHPSPVTEAEAEGVYDCFVRGAPCEWGGLLRAQLDAVSEPFVIRGEADLGEALRSMAGVDHNELCACQLEKILCMVAEGSRDFFARIRRSNAEVHSGRVRYDAPSPVKTLEEAKKLDTLFGYGAAVLYLTDEIRGDFNLLADYFDVRDGMEDTLYESDLFYLAADKGLLNDKLPQIIQAGGKQHTYPFIPDEIKLRFPKEYTARLLREGTIRYADIPEELRENPVITPVYENAKQEEEVFYDSSEGVEENGILQTEETAFEGWNVSDEIREPLNENLVYLKLLSENCAEAGIRASLNPLSKDATEEHEVYELSLSLAGRVFYFTADSCDPWMPEMLSGQIRAVAERQAEPELRDMLLAADGKIREERPEAIGTEAVKKEAIGGVKADQPDKVFTGAFEDYYDYGLGY